MSKMFYYDFIDTCIKRSESQGEWGRVPFPSLLPIPLGARFAHRRVFAASPFVSPFSTDWNAELRKLHMKGIKHATRFWNGKNSILWTSAATKTKIFGNLFGNWPKSFENLNKSLEIDILASEVRENTP